MRINEFINEQPDEQRTAPYGVIVQTNGKKIIVGDNHKTPIIVDPNTKADIERVGDAYGYYSEGTASPNLNPAYVTFKDGIQKNWKGSWDKDLIPGNDHRFLYTLFSNVDDGENKQSSELTRPGSTIIDTIVSNRNWGVYPGTAVNMQSVTKFLNQGSTPQMNLVDMAKQEATPENVKTFLGIGEKQMWDTPGTPLHKLALGANEMRDQHLIRKGPGVYFAGAGHLITISQMIDKKMIDGSRAHQ